MSEFDLYSIQFRAAALLPTLGVLSVVAYGARSRICFGLGFVGCMAGLLLPDWAVEGTYNGGAFIMALKDVFINTLLNSVICGGTGAFLGILVEREIGCRARSKGDGNALQD